MQITETLQFFAEHFGEASAIVWNMAMFLTVVAGLILGLLTGSFLHRNHMAEMDEDTMLVIRRREMWREEHRKELEEEMLQKINGSGIGPGGLGGSTTALAVNINTYATHIAGLPVAVNICCHVNRHAVRTL